MFAPAVESHLKSVCLSPRPIKCLARTVALPEPIANCRELRLTSRTPTVFLYRLLAARAAVDRAAGVRVDLAIWTDWVIVNAKKVRPEINTPTKHRRDMYGWSHL